MVSSETVNGIDPSNKVKRLEQEEVNDSPIEQVRLTVPITDDPTLPCLTFRTWVLGTIACAVLAFLNQFFVFRQTPLYISWGSSWQHLYQTKKIHPLAALLLTQTTQMLGYGWAGVFRKFLVDSPYMWWPNNLVQVSLFRALHEEERRPKGGLSRLQFFVVVLVSSFAYYIIPNYLFQSITALSFVCWIWKDSITAQQIGSGLHGLGIGSFGFDWSTISSFLGSPLATPGFAVMNLLVGYIIILYIMLPVTYWTDAYGAKRFPIISSHVFDSSGQPYNVTLILNSTDFSLNEDAYNGYNQVNLSIFFVYAYGLSFALLAATLSHVALFHGRLIWAQAKAAFTDKFGDVHTRIMKKNYEVVPQWWFYTILIVIVGLAMLACEGFDKQLQLPYWGVLLSISLAFFFTLPIGVIQATTNQQPGLNVITELIIGYMYPGKPLANVTFKTYGFISMSQAIMFIADFKLGHYMKIPPKSMFIVQLVGTVIASATYFGTAWWLLHSIENICDPKKLPKGSPWTCPGDDVFYNASIIWGLIGPLRMFGRLGLYYKMNYFFLIGLLAPFVVWIFSRIFPEKKWIKLINIPVILSGTGAMPSAKAVNYISWFTVALFFNFVVYNRYRKWWARHNYILSAGLDAGVAFLAILCYFTLQMKDIDGPKWWGLELDDHCPLATCPTAPGIVADGCPVLR